MSCAAYRLLSWTLLACLLFSSACAEPPTKELDQAQGAIEAARAAGADRYAPDELKLATDALDRARVAVTQRDYRQALSHALDAKERAREAARTGAEHMAQRRSEAEQAIDTTTRALTAAQARLGSPEGGRLPGPVQATARAGLKSASHTLQEARTAFDSHAFPQARQKADAALSAIRDVMATVGDAQGRGRRPAQRRP